MRRREGRQTSNMQFITTPVTIAPYLLIIIFQQSHCLAFTIRYVVSKISRHHHDYQLSLNNDNVLDDLSATFPSIDTEERVDGRDIIDHVCMLDKSLRNLTGNGVFERMIERDNNNNSNTTTTYDNDRAAIYKNICLNPRWVLISHGVENDPIYNFINIAGLHAFYRTWDEVRKLPSRKSVVLQSKDEELRIVLMENVTNNGFVEGASGIRTRGDGQFVKLVDAVVWNCYDDNGVYSGQAALFDRDVCPVLSNLE